MGFGHRIYKVKDPRARIMQGLAETVIGELMDAIATMVLPSP